MKEKSYFFTHKFLPVLSVFLLCFFIFSTSCFANDNNSIIYTCDCGSEKSVILPQGYGTDYYYYAIVTDYKSDSNYCGFRLVLSKDVIFKNYYGLSSVSGVYCKGDSRDSSYSLFNFDDLTLSDFLYYNNGVNLGFHDPNSSDIISYSNQDIYDEDGNLVFQGAPVTVEQVTIPAIQQVEEIPQAMGEVLKILIPIGLIVFSIGLVIYLMRLVILRVQ